MVINHPPLSQKYLSSCLVWVMWRAPLRVGPESYRSIETQFPDIFLFFIFWDPIPRRFCFSFSLRPNFRKYFYSLFFLDPKSRHVSLLLLRPNSQTYFYSLLFLVHFTLLIATQNCLSNSISDNWKLLKTDQLAKKYFLCEEEQEQASLFEQTMFVKMKSILDQSEQFGVTLRNLLLIFSLSCHNGKKSEKRCCHAEKGFPIKSAKQQSPHRCMEIKEVAWDFYIESWYLSEKYIKVWPLLYFDRISYREVYESMTALILSPYI